MAAAAVAAAAAPVLSATNVVRSATSHATAPMAVTEVVGTTQASRAARYRMNLTVGLLLLRLIWPFLSGLHTRSQMLQLR